MKLPCPLLLLFPCVVAAAAPALAPVTPAPTVPTLPETSITVIVDPRIELVAITQHLSGYAEHYKGRINDFDYPYLREIRAHFARFKNHEAVLRLAALRVGGSDPVGIAVHLTDPDDVRVLGPIDRAVVRTDQAEAYVSALRAFAQATGFMAFYRSHQAAYDRLIGDFKQAVDTAAIAGPIERYCGGQRGRYVIVLAPLLGRTSFGPNVTMPDGSKVFYAILPSAGVTDGRLWFGGGKRMDEYLTHEFGHSFVNPLVEKHWEQFAKYSGLMARVKYQSSANYGRDWKICVGEHLDRAVTARIVRLREGDAAYEQRLAEDRRRGFIFVDDLCRALATYESDREKYPNLESFLPGIVHVFAALQESSLARPDQS